MFRTRCYGNKVQLLIFCPPDERNHTLSQAHLYSVYKQATERKAKGKHDQRDLTIISLWDTVADLLTEKKNTQKQLDEFAADNRKYARDLDMLNTKLAIAEGKPITLGQFGTTLVQ